MRTYTIGELVEIAVREGYRVVVQPTETPQKTGHTLFFLGMFDVVIEGRITRKRLLRDFAVHGAPPSCWNEPRDTYEVKQALLYHSPRAFRVRLKCASCKRRKAEREKAL